MNNPEIWDHTQNEQCRHRVGQHAHGVHVDPPYVDPEIPLSNRS